MGAASCAPVILLICYGHLCGLVKADPMPAAECHITTSGNKAFLTCKFPINLHETKINFNVIYVNKTSKTRSSNLQPEKEIAFACFWRSGTISCNGMDGYSLKSTSDTDTLVFEVPFSTVTNLEYFCQFINFTDSEKLCPLTTTDMSGGVRNEGPSSAHDATQDNQIPVINVVVGLVTVILEVLILMVTVNKRNTRRQRCEHGSERPERTRGNTCALFSCCNFGDVTGNTNARAEIIGQQERLLVCNGQQPGYSHPPPYIHSLTDVNGPGPSSPLATHSTGATPWRQPSIKQPLTQVPRESPEKRMHFPCPSDDTLPSETSQDPAPKTPGRETAGGLSTSIHQDTTARTVVVETISRSETEKRLLSPNQRDGAFLFRTTMRKTTLALAVRRSSTNVTYHQISVKESGHYEIDDDGKPCSFNSLATLKKYFTTSDGLFDKDRFKNVPLTMTL